MMGRQEKLTKLIDDIAADLGGFIGASVVDLETGMSLASRSRVASFDLDVASAYNSEMVKAKNKAINALNIQSDLEDMLLTLSDQIHLIKMLEPQVFIYVAASREGTNLAMLRTTVASKVRELGY